MCVCVWYDLCAMCVHAWRGCRGVCRLWQRAERTEEECVSPPSLFLKTGYLLFFSFLCVWLFLTSLFFSSVCVCIAAMAHAHVPPPSLWQQSHAYIPSPPSSPPSVEEKSLLFIMHLCVMLLCDAGSLLSLSLSLSVCVCVCCVFLTFLIFCIVA